MNSWNFKGMLAAAIGAGLIFQPAHAGQASPPTCSLATLKGIYMFAQSGYATAAANGPLAGCGKSRSVLFSEQSVPLSVAVTH